METLARRTARRPSANKAIEMNVSNLRGIRQGNGGTTVLTSNWMTLFGKPKGLARRSIHETSMSAIRPEGMTAKSGRAYGIRTRDLLLEREVS
ncbi:hypothetical protein RPALISO_2 [Ruegeria phage RpAliso]|nr:hypothetical protein RPALISO_2 [Ruegeria phage RpAliso]